MASAAAAVYRTEVFAPQGVITGTAISQSMDVFARRERRATSLTMPVQNRFTVRLLIEGTTVRLAYTTFESGLPPWADPVLESLAERWGVQPGWDSYQAVPTAPQLVVKLLNSLSGLMEEESVPPQITPLADGGVQAEWHQGSQDLEIVVSAQEKPTYYYFNHATNEEEEGDLDQEHARVQDLIRQLR